MKEGWTGQVQWPTQSESENVIDRADVTFMQCNKDLHILSPGSKIRKCANGLKGMKSADVLRKITQKKMANGLTTTEGLKNGTVAV